MKKTARWIMLPVLTICATISGTAVLANDVPLAVIPPPPPGKGEVVFFRPSGMGFAISCAVKENGVKVSSLPPGHYFVTAADPGKHAYSVASEATDTLNVQVESGEVQFVSCHIKMGIMAGRPVLNPATEGAFRERAYKEVVPPKSAMQPAATTPAAMAPTAAPIPETPTATPTPAAQ